MDGCQEILQTVMQYAARQFVVIQSGTPQPAIIQGETERPYEVQARSGVGAQAYNIAGIRRDFRLI